MEVDDERVHSPLCKGSTHIPHSCRLTHPRNADDQQMGITSETGAEVYRIMGLRFVTKKNVQLSLKDSSVAGDSLGRWSRSLSRSNSPTGGSTNLCW